MPNERIVPETDGDPRTVYEDTNAHERLGLRIDDTKDIGDFTVFEEENGPTHG